MRIASVVSLALSYLTSTEAAGKTAGVRRWSIAVPFVSVLIYRVFFF